jgi:hypothetical protein
MLFIHRLLRGCDRCRPGTVAIRWSARSQARTNDLDGGENVGGQLDLPAGGCEDSAVAITEGDRTPRGSLGGRCAVIPRRAPNRRESTGPTA